MQKLIQSILPSYCAWCQGRTSDGHAWCASCYQRLPWNYHACERCGIALVNQRDRICGECLVRPPPFTKTVTTLHYLTPITKMLHQLKYGRGLRFGKLFGDLLCMQVQKSYQVEDFPRLIIPVPLHYKRIQQRGCNQALEITRQLTSLKIPIDFKCCQRTQHKKPQSKCHAHERHKNIQGAFRMVKKLPCKHVAIVDDVVTTSATVSELSKLLLQSGAQRVDVWCVARAQMKK